MPTPTRRTQSPVLGVLLACSLAVARTAAGASDANASGPAGGSEPLDLAPFGYLYRSDASPGANPSETQWLTHDTPDVLAGVMWEEHRPVRRIAVVFDGPAPAPESLRLEVTTSTPTEKQNNRPTWWTRAYETFPGAGKPTANPNELVFETDLQTIKERLNTYPEGFRYEADPQGLLFVDKVRVRFPGSGPRPRVLGLQVFGVAGVVPLRLTIEWGMTRNAALRRMDGRLEIYNGQLGPLRPAPGSRGCSIQAPASWTSIGNRRVTQGVEVEVGYIADDTQAVVFRPSLDLPAGSDGRLSYHPNRTVLTLRTSAGDVSLAPRDLADGQPMFIPALGILVRQAGTASSASEALRQVQAQMPPTTRQRVRALPEQSLARALADQYTTQRPPYPTPECEPPMAIDVPDELAGSAWRTAFWHVQRRCQQEDGVYQIYIWPYKALLGQESWRIFQALDLLGEHSITKSGFEPWFRAQGTRVARGMFSDQDGALNVSGWDLNHAQGHGSMLFALAQHYLLTGDRDWLIAHQTNLVAASDWIQRQRRHWVDTAGPGSWSAGLMPPCEMGDYADWRSLYQTSVFYWRGLKAAAEALGELDAATGARFAREAEDFRQAILRAVERSRALTPVMRVGDGTYRRYLPPQPYLRGMCEQITNPFGGAHAGSLVMDGDLGAAALGLGVIGPQDPALDELLDVLEDVIYRDNWMVRKHAHDRQGDHPDSWFTIGGYYYQCGYSQSALVHLCRDDVPNFLRSTFNQYAADIDPDQGYQFREHPNRTGEGNGGDKTFEAAAFLERMRAMFVMEDRDCLWLARATPRAWLEQGKRVSVRNAPSHFGTVSYDIVSGVQHGTVTATVEMPSRRAPGQVLFRLRHPQGAPLRTVKINGKAWRRFDKDKEVIHLEGLTGHLELQARY